MALPQFSINPYVQPFVGGLSQQFKEGVDERIKRYEAALEYDDVLGYQNDTLIQNIGPFENDTAFANQLMNDTRNQIASRAEKGDYENMLREVRRSARNFAGQAQPLLTNRKLYDEYREQLRNMKDVDEVTKQRALQFSSSNYKGIDPNNPNTTFFKGFMPAKTVNVGKALDDFYTGWKADKGSREIINPDGTISTISWEQAQKGDGVKSGAQIMREAGEAYIKGSPEVSDYVNTQLTVGNQDRLQTEVEGAFSSNLQKHFYTEMGQGVSFVPDWMRDEQKEANPNIYSSPSSVSDNIHASNIFKGAKLVAGNLVMDNQYYSPGGDGSYYKITDKNGNVVPFAEAKDKIIHSDKTLDAGDRMLISQNDNAFATAAKKAGYNYVQATPQEVVAKRNQDNKDFDKLVIDTYADDNAPIAYQGDEKLKTAWAQKRLSGMSNADLVAYRNQVLDRYNSMQDNSVVETQKWNKNKVTDVKLVGDIEQISDVGVLASSLGGRGVQLMTKNSDIDVDLPQGSDINELYKQLGEEGWVPVKLNDNGLLKYNPKMNVPGSSVTLKVKKGTGEDAKYRDLELVVGIGNADQVPQLQALQKVMQRALSGNSGWGFQVPNSKAGYYVKVTPGNKTPEGGIDRRAVIVRVDSDGNQIGTVPIDAFPDFFMQSNPSAAYERNRLLTNPK